MKTFMAAYSRYLGCGEYREHRSVVVAETQQAALGLALEAFLETEAAGWAFEEIDVTKSGAHYMPAE